MNFLRVGKIPEPLAWYVISSDGLAEWIRRHAFSNLCRPFKHRLLHKMQWPLLQPLALSSQPQHHYH
eukprot:12757840-Heterocapsa_arctica.AAC.1